MLNFRKRYKNVHTHYLPVNFRSTDAIVNLGRELIVKNKKHLPKDIKSTGTASQRGDIYKSDKAITGLTG